MRKSSQNIVASGVAPEDECTEEVSVKQALISAYQDNLYCRLHQELDGDEKCVWPKNGGRGENKNLGEWATTWWEQFGILLRRGVKERKYDSFSCIKIGQVLVVALISGLLWWQSDSAHLQDKVLKCQFNFIPFHICFTRYINSATRGVTTDYTVQIGLFFFYSAFWGFFPLFQAIFTFPEERLMLEKERSSGMYRLSSYFMSRVFGDLPLELVLPTVFVVITYLMAGLKPTIAHFLNTLFVLLYSVLVAQGLGLAIGALVMDQKAATTFGSVLMLSFLLAGGYYVQSVPPFIAWIRYISISHYTYKLLMGSQFRPGETYPCGHRDCLVGEFPSVKNVGLDGQVWAFVALGIMLVGYRLIAYVALMRIGVTRR